ncbi:AI-2E family transporter [Staphylospora marina]|uniref:AI-2E family transporter n=1 Tax=Staphylospora marina TaxID=2490858 RepID=UPI000F5BE511|nr:AI-2E family transporter [Staphylospora marina]
MERWNLPRMLNLSILGLILLGSFWLLLQMSPWIGRLFQFLKAVLGPFFVAMIISYLLNPVVNLLNQRGMSRSLAVLFIYTLFLVCIGVLIVNLVPLLGLQLNELAEHLPEWNAKLQTMIREYNDHGKELLPPSVQAGIDEALRKLESGISEQVERMMGGLGALLNQLLTVLIIPFLAFYMMKDIKVIERSLVHLVPQNRRRGIIRLVREMDQALGNYIRGQLLVCGVVGLLAYIGYLIVGVPYALLLALMVAVFNVIPYLGPIFGAIPAVLVALTQSPGMVLGVLIVNLVVQMLEGNVISPQIVGRTLHMHPLFIIFALLVGGEIGGIWGLILAVPLFAIGKVVVDHLIRHVILHRNP